MRRRPTKTASNSPCPDPLPSAAALDFSSFAGSVTRVFVCASMPISRMYWISWSSTSAGSR